MSQMPSALAKPATLCAFCPKMCRFACPVAEAEGKESVTPWAKMSLLYLERDGQLSDEERRLSSTPLEACTGCGACVEQCAHGNPVAESLFVARDAMQTDRSSALREAFLATGDAKRRDLSGPLRALPTDATAPVAYFPGCTRLAADDDGTEKDREALSIALEQDVPACDLPRNRVCCGYPLYADGQLEVLADHLSDLWSALSQHRFVVTPDPGCAYVLSVVRRTVLGSPDDEGPSVLPLVEVLAAYRHRFEGRSHGLELRYHDPCYLGRRGRSFSAPRALLTSACGRPPLEFAQHHDEADCSGGGGLYPMSNPEGARAIAARRLTRDGAVRTAPARVVTACPSAQRNFRRAGHEVLDVVDVALGRAGNAEPAAGEPGGSDGGS